jgi:surface protein
VLNTVNITNFTGVFDGCTTLPSLTALSTWNTSSGTTFIGTFARCSTLTTLTGLSGWSFVPNVNLYSMFEGCTLLADLSAISGWRFNVATNISSIFNNCLSLTDANVLQIANWSRFFLYEVSRIFGNNLLITRTTYIGSIIPAVLTEYISISGWNAWLGGTVPYFG